MGVELTDVSLPIDPAIVSRSTYLLPTRTVVRKVGGVNRLEADSWESADKPSIEGCLERFIRLDITKPDQVESFANRWGFIGICIHGKPAGHLDKCLPLSRTNDSNTRTSWEPLASWLVLRGQALAILSFAAQFQLEGTAGWTAYEFLRQTFFLPSISAEFWEPHPLADQLPADSEEYEFFPDCDSETELDSELSRLVLDHVLRVWFRYGSVRIVPTWTEGTTAPAYGLGISGLMGTLAAQLAAALSSPLGIHFCDECHLPHTRSRRPQSKRDKYCPDCSAGGDLAAKRASYHRRKHLQNVRSTKEVTDG